MNQDTKLIVFATERKIWLGEIACQDLCLLPACCS